MSAPEDAAAARQRVLVVDDNASGRYVTVHALKRAGYDVLEARTGAEGIARAAEQVDLIVLDVNLPDMDGFFVCRQLRLDADLRHLPVLMASASYLTAENTVQGLNDGADAYLAHPIDPGVLIATVRALLRMRAAEAEVRHLNITLEQRVSERTTALQQSNQQLTQANEELQSFSASVSHDLRTPVRHVKGFSELARRALTSQRPEQAVQHLQVVEQAADRMNVLIDSLLLLSRITRRDLNLGPVNLTALVSTALDDLAGELRNRDIDFKIAPLPTVPGDWQSLQQVMVQLLANAIKFTGRQQHASIDVWATTDAHHITVSVRDNGVGFDPRYQDRLFSPFQRLHSDRDFGGVGVGLAIVRRVILLHHGRVTAHSQLGEGATFTFTLPTDR